MRKLRHLSPSAELSASLYHVHSRCVDRSFKFEEGQRGAWIKDKFVQMMREYEELLGVRVQSYCLMSNHIHLLLEVPPKKKGAAVPMPDEVFLGKIKAFYSRDYYVDVKQMLERFRKGGSDKAAEKLKARFTSRMYDLSEFMKSLKQRFTQWYNKTHERTGTLWEGRFKSVLVEDGYAARVMSAYIDLNPIRAGMVSRPEDYRWSSYGEAMKPKADAGRALARAGLCRVMQLYQETGGRVSTKQSEVLWEGDDVTKAAKGTGKEKGIGGKSVGTTAKEGVKEEGDAKGITGAQWYRMMLFADGEEAFSSKPAIGVEKILVRKGFKRDEVESVLAKGGKLSFGETLRCKVRCLTDGMVFGTRDFVDKVFKGSREHFSEKRTTGARPIRGVGWKAGGDDRLYSMRALKKEVIK